MIRIRRSGFLVVACLLACPSTSHAQTGTGVITSEAGEPRSWHLLQRQYDNLIRSITHGLTKHECEFAANRVMGRPATPEEVAAKERRDAQEAERHKAERDKFLAEHPKCNTDPPPAILECGVAVSASAYTATYRSADIVSAECFE